MTRIRVTVADDQPVVREGLISIINRQDDMVVIDEASTADQAVALAVRGRPDIILIDLRMSGMAALEAIDSIRRFVPQSRIIVLTICDGEEDIHAALKAGARGYLLKNASRDELLGAIRAVHAGQRRIQQQLAARLAEHILVDDLTRRETEVLRRIVHGESNKEIAHALSITSGTVKGHLSNIFLKLDVRDRTQAAVVALRRGIVHTN